MLVRVQLVWVVLVCVGTGKNHFKWKLLDGHRTQSRKVENEFIS
jgi:hypothetical protein